jgi:hypothetical protein
LRFDEEKQKGKDVIRISVCSWATTEKDVNISVKSFVQARELSLHPEDSWTGLR